MPNSSFAFADVRVAPPGDAYFQPVECITTQATVEKIEHPM